MTDPGEQPPTASDDDELTSLRSELEAIDEVPVADRVALFERANATIARELAELDEV